MFGIKIRMHITIVGMFQTLPLLLLFILAISSSTAQIQNLKIPRAQIASPGGYDTSAVKQGIENSVESIGFLETVIDPSTYIVGPGDVLSIFVQRVSPVQYSVPVMPDGTVIIPEVGMIAVSEKTLLEAKNIIKKRITNIINTQSVEVALSKIRTFKVTLLGAVRKPGTLSATPADRLHEILDRAGGITSLSSMRMIRINREKNETIYVDLQKFYVYGDKTQSPHLLGGDIIYIPYASQRDMIRVNGEVNEQTAFEFHSGDKLSDALTFAGWFTSFAERDSVEIYRYNDAKASEKIIVSCKDWMYNPAAKTYDYQGDVLLKERDKVFIRKGKNASKFDEVAIGGEVNYEGRYVIETGKTTILDIINDAGGIKNDADITRAGLVRREDAFDPDYEFSRIEKIPADAQTESEKRYYRTRLRQFRGLMLVDFEKLLLNKDNTNNLLLRPGDSIFIPRKVEYITVTGRVAKPGRIIYERNKRIEDYIRICGGFASQADESEIFVLRSSGESVEASEIEQLKPQDEIMVPEKTSNSRLFFDIMTVVTQIITIAAVVVSLSR